MMLWQVAEDLETLQAVETVVFSTSLGGYLETPYSYIGMMKQSAYEFPKVRGQEGQTTIAPSDSRYLFVYPFVKKRDWYALPLEQRQAAMNDHVRIGRRYPSVRISTVHSFGLDDQEFMVAFEADDPSDLVDLVMELRESEASAYTERDVPVFTCIQMSIWEMLDALGGASLAERAEAVEPDADGFVPVAELDELPSGTSRRVYLGTEAVAVFNIDGKYFAVSDRRTHGRGSLSEGKVDRKRCILECPWHGGWFDLATGIPAGGPPVVPIRTFRIKVEGQRILVG